MNKSSNKLKSFFSLAKSPTWQGYRRFGGGGVAGGGGLKGTLGRGVLGAGILSGTGLGIAGVYNNADTIFPAVRDTAFDAFNGAKSGLANMAGDDWKSFKRYYKDDIKGMNNLYEGGKYKLFSGLDSMMGMPGSAKEGLGNLWQGVKNAPGNLGSGFHNLGANTLETLGIYDDNTFHRY